MKKWFVSLASTILILAGGAYGFFYIKDKIPNELSSPSKLVVKAEEKSVEKEDTPELKEIISNTQKLVVQIELEDGSLGSGFIYNNKGDIVTNAHVVANTKKVTVINSDSKKFSGNIIGISTETDVAVVRVPELKRMQPLKISRKQKAEMGDEVMALGSPLGLQNTVTTGIISGVDRTLNIGPFHYKNVYQISAPIAHGNSGGPLIDRKTGEVLGINSAGSESGDIGFSIPIISVLPILEGWSDSPMTSLPEISLEVENFGYKEEVPLDVLSEYLVNFFYESLNDRDYLSAYSLLGSKWQSSVSFEKFQEEYSTTTSVTVEDVTTNIKEDKVLAVTMISAEQKNDDKTELNKYEVAFEIRYENDHLKLISKDVEEFE